MFTRSLDMMAAKVSDLMEFSSPDSVSLAKIGGRRKVRHSRVTSSQLMRTPNLGDVV